MAEFFRVAVGSAEQKTRDTKGSRSKKLSKGSRSLPTRSSKKARKVQDRFATVSSTSSFVPASKHARGEETTPDEPAPRPSPPDMPAPQPSPPDMPTEMQTPETRPPPQLGYNNVEPTDNQAEMDSSRDNNTTTTPTFKRVGDRPGVYEPTVYESTSKDTIELTVILPGVHADGVAVTLAEGVLFIVVENAVIKINEGPVVTEHETATLEYKKMLPKGIQAEDIHAWMKNGVLTVTCPVEDTTPRPVKILTSSRSKQQ
ncbi:hypothetical protein EYR36_008454 [Pleurotus pulmonarius]|nr:hypothetical protein EYR36_008454 [Pleurotus pulmonarius]